MSDIDPAPDPDRLACIEQALAEYLLAADAGAARDPALWLARYPDLQPELGELLAAEAGLRRLAGPLRPDSSSEPSTVQAQRSGVTRDDARGEDDASDGAAPLPGVLESATSATTRSGVSWGGAAWAFSMRPGRSA
jgi:hypothetical protein